MLLASGQGILTAYFTCHIQSFIILLHSFFYNLLRLRLFLFILGSTQPSIQWVLRGLPPGYRSRGVKPTIRLDKVPKLKMCRAVPPLTHTSLRHIQEQLYILRCFLCCSVMFFPISIHVTFTFLHSVFPIYSHIMCLQTSRTTFNASPADYHDCSHICCF